MSSQAALRVPLWAERYLPDFAALLRIVERAEHFFLQPVETPSPDLARALAGWLQGQGWQVRVVEVEGEAGWLGLAEALEAAPEAGQRRVVVVIAPYDLDGELLRTALARVNLQRDAIVRAMDCPLLWCGTRAFARSTWEYAADFWSIASTPYRIPLRDPEQVRRDDPGALLWWTGAASEEVDTLEHAYRDAVAEGADPATLTRLGLRLAECQFVRRDPEAAAQTLVMLRPLVDLSAERRWQMLSNSVGIALAGSEGAGEHLRRRIAAAEARGAKATEARLRVELAETLQLHPDAEVRGEGQRQLYRARELFVGEGDRLAVLRVDERISDLGQSPPVEMISGMIANAQSLLRDGSDRALIPVAGVVLARLLLLQGRRAEAERILDEMLAYETSAGGSPQHLDFLQMRSTLARDAEDWPRAYELDTRMLEQAESGQVDGLASGLRYRRGEVCEAWGKRLHACVDYLVCARISRRLSQFDRVVAAMSRASALASGLGLARVGGTLVIQSGLAVLHLLSIDARRVVGFDSSGLRAAGDVALADRIDALGRWVAEVKPTLSAAEVQAKLAEFEHEFAMMLEAREAELRVEGIDAMDPLTWGVSEEPPVGRSQG
ncbi:MAG: hypothetical protein JNK56_00900 [Myxococcales bacterium]|nr:hypothetical protein [Myxococcales bacterium]